MAKGSPKTKKAVFDLRKIGVILAIAILFSIFTFATINAVYPQPQYDDYCTMYGETKPYIAPMDPSNCKRIKGPSETESQTCFDQKGMITYRYDEFGCPSSWTCDFCQRDLNAANEKHAFIEFIISSIFALIALLIGLYLPTRKSDLNEWVGTGFMLGGLITLFAGTAMVYGELHRVIKPIIILAELLIVLYLAYRKFGNK